MIPDPLRKEILDDIFGRKSGSSLFEGLVDCIDQNSFEEKLPIMMNKWERIEEHSQAVSGFCEWLLKNKVDVILYTMIRPVREEGFGLPSRCLLHQC